MNTGNYSVCIIKDEDQLTEALKLRYKTYEKIYPEIINGHPFPYESDLYDIRSVHIGLYYESDYEKKLVGYCRMIIPSVFKKYYEQFFIKQHPNYFFNEGYKTDLPVIDFILDEKIKEVINLDCANMEKNNLVYAEIGRLMIDENHRSLSMISSFVLSFFAISQVLNIKYHFFGCVSLHTTFYKRFGLNVFEKYNEISSNFKSIGKFALLKGDPFNPPVNHQLTIAAFKQQLMDDRQITQKLFLSKAA